VTHSEIRIMLEFGLRLFGYNIILADRIQWQEQAKLCPYKRHDTNTSFCFPCKMIFIALEDLPTVTDHYVSQWVEQIVQHYSLNDAKPNEEAIGQILRDGKGVSRLRLSHD